MEFKEITLEDARVLTLVYGRYNSGKTHTALDLATAICPPSKKIALIDTEGKRSALFKRDFDFVSFDASVTNDPDEYAKFVEKLDKKGDFGVILLDSISEAWDGDKNGVLAQAAELEREANEGEKKKTVKGQLKWTPAKAGWNRLIAQLRRAGAAVIVTAKEKPETDPVTKKQTGEFAPVMEKSTPHMFDLVLHMEDRKATIDKMMSDENLVGTVFKPTPDTLTRLYHKALGLTQEARKQPIPLLQ